jgi:TorA maturation chaperone TorD
VLPSELISPEDKLRAQIYRLLAGYLSHSPEKSSLEAASVLKSDDGEFGEAIGNFAKIAARTTEDAADTEFHDLFVGVTRGELLPFGSYYQTGFLNEKPLAKLRADMAKLGIERVSEQKEPEDHIASVLEMIAGLIEGDYGQPLSLNEQKNFFDTHVNSWASHFFSDLEGAKKSVLYAPLGTIGRLFMNIERDAFEMC